MYGLIGRTIGGKLVAVAAAGMLGAGVLGGVAAASTAPEGTSSTAISAGIADQAAAKDRGDKAGGLKKILDALVAKGTITQAQEDAILSAVGPAHPKGKSVGGDRSRATLGGALKASEQYLGLTGAQLRGELKAGKSLGDIANATSGKSRDGLVAALTADANARIDARLAAGKLTVDQAADVKAKAAAAIAKLVDHTGHAPKPAAPGATN